MNALTNPRHEHFAQIVAGGMTTGKAYIAAGFSVNGAAQSGCRLLKTAKVAARVMSLRSAVAERAIEKAAVDQAWVLEKLIENTNRAMQAEPVRDSDGNMTGEYQYAGAVANRALELVGKHLGMFVERKDITVREANALSDADLVAAIAEAAGGIVAAREAASADPATRTSAPGDSPPFGGKVH